MRLHTCVVGLFYLFTFTCYYINDTECKLAEVRANCVRFAHYVSSEEEKPS
jgi:hypothetical protein